MRRQILEADLTWTGERFTHGVRVAVGADGRIEAVGDLPDAPTQRLTDIALLPGFINVHSHAFQRGLRGRGETFPSGAGSFWSWREEMYRLVDSMDEATIAALSRQAFEEMLAAGITTVGEFHYLHHDSSGAGYALDEVVLRTAKEVGIRLVLLNTFYHTGGLNHTGHLPLAGGQLRFNTRSIEEYWRQFERLSAALDPDTQSMGAVAHSIRAAPIEMIAELHQEAVRRHLPFHMHVEEQPREIEDCVHRYGKPPMALLNEHLAIDPKFTAIHCTHTAGADLDDFLNAGGNVGICPMSEANLGDGLANVPAMLRRGGHICIGTDANTRLSMTEELRWLEYGQRLAHQKRGVCVDSDGRVAEQLLEMGTVNGARSLGLRAGAIKPGLVADFIAIDLRTPTLAGFDPSSLLTAFILGTGNEAIARVCVGGHWRHVKRTA